MDEKNTLKLNLSRFMLFIFALLLILITLIFVVINLKGNIQAKDSQIASLKESVRTLKKQVPLASSSNDNSTEIDNYEKKLGTYENQINNYKNEINTYKNELETLREDYYGLKMNLTEFEKETEGKENFILGRYSYYYDVIIEEGQDSQWELNLSVSFAFKEDNTVWANLAGHESGSLVGTYEVFKDSIKCTFTEYENESSGTYGAKLDQEEIVVLRRVNDKQLSFLTHNDKTMSEDFDIENGEIRFFTYEPSIVY